MRSLRSTFVEDLLTLSAKLSRWLFRDNISEIEKSLSTEAKAKLLQKAERECLNLNLGTINENIAKLLFSPQAMLAHPFLINFIRPASRMASNLGHRVGHIPVVSNPSLVFAGRAVSLEGESVKIAEIPLGSILLLREIGLCIVSLHNAIEYGEPEKIYYFARVARFLSGILFKPAAVAFSVGQVAFSSMPTSYRVYGAQAAHVLGVFLILHELGHICLNHNLDPLSDEQCRSQEFEADIFAMEGEFSPKKGKARFEPFRKLQMIYVCNMFSIFDIGLADAGIELDGYPTFASRREALLAHFASGHDVMSSVGKFETAITNAPRPEFGDLGL